MLKNHRRRRQVAKVRAGDGSPLPDYRLWQLFSRSLFTLDLDGREVAVDIRHAADSTSRKSPASLYRDGVQVARATLPVTFPVPGGVIEVATSQYGVKRVHFVDEGGEHVLRPHPRSPEGLRARFARRFPRASAAVGVLAVAVVLAGLAVTLSVALESITRVPAIAEHVGTFVPPVHLSAWVRTATPIAGAVAAVERALTLRSRWLIGG